jgi:hypothetical protein
MNTAPHCGFWIAGCGLRIRNAVSANRNRLAAVLALMIMGSTAFSAESGTARFVPVGDQGDIPERYRLGERDFTWRMEHRRTLLDGAVEMYAVTFPSPVE